MNCVHHQHSLLNYYETTYSEQTCRRCVLTRYNKVDKLPVEKSKNVNTEEVKEDLRLETRHGMYRDANDIRPSEIPEFLSNISLNDHILKRHGPAWENQEVEIDKTLLKDDAKPPQTASLTEERMKDIEYGRKLLRDKEKLNRLSTDQFYKTTTHKLYEGADWCVFLKPKPTPPLHTMTFNNTYPPSRIKWRNDRIDRPQTLPGQLSWDYLQERDTQGKENAPLSFTTCSRKTNQIPNYTGMIVGSGEKDVANKPFTPLINVRTQQPRYMETSRKPHIPGYGGFTSWDRSKEVFSEEPLPRPESTAGTYRRHDICSSESSLYRHRAPLSKTVTLVNPFNPYNEVNYPLCRTVGENRI